MKIDTSTIEGYENMSAEEKLAALEGFEYEDLSGEVERYKNAASKANAEAAKLKREQRERLSEEERAKAEREEKDAQILEELENLRKEKRVSGFAKNFVTSGFDADLAVKAAEAIVDGNTDDFFKSLNKFIETHDKAVKADLLKKGLKPEEGKPDNPLTVDEIMKIEDPVERQKAIADNLHLFKGV